MWWGEQDDKGDEDTEAPEGKYAARWEVTSSVVQRTSKEELHVLK